MEFDLIETSKFQTDTCIVKCSVYLLPASIFQINVFWIGGRLSRRNLH